MEPVASVSVLGFTANAWFADGALLVRMEGNADLTAQPALASFVPQVHAAALERQVPMVTTDLRLVDFMNSSCIKVLVTWLQLVTDEEPERRYRIRLQQGTQHHWQNRSLKVLKAFADDLVDIER